MNLRPIAAAAVLLSLACSKPEDSAVAPVAGSPTEGRAAAASASASAPTTAPDVTFTLSDGFRLTLASLRGKVVAVIVCPAINAPGCTRESQGLTRRWRELEEHYVTAVGVVPDANAQYRAAMARRDVPFEFAADADGQVARALGVSTRDADPIVLLVARDGTIRTAWRTADPDMHIRELIAASQR
jgi:peroxiredoxin Q/BCP